MKRSFSGGSLAFFLALGGGGIVMVAVAILKEVKWHTTRTARRGEKRKDKQENQSTSQISKDTKSRSGSWIATTEKRSVELS